MSVDIKHCERHAEKSERQFGADASNYNDLGATGQVLPPQDINQSLPCTSLNLSLSNLHNSLK